jgi:hypothetical protein
MAEVVDVEQWARMQAMWWPRLRSVLNDYGREKPKAMEWQRLFLADVLSMLADPESNKLEMSLALAARDAGIKIRTGKLRVEQERVVSAQPIATGHPREELGEKR